MAERDQLGAGCVCLDAGQKRVRVVVGMERKLGGGEMGKHW